MDVRFTRDRGTMQKKLVLETQRHHRPEPIAAPVPAPDLTDFMNDMFFGVKSDNKAYNLTGGDSFVENDEEDGYKDASNARSSNSKLTQEWLEEARRIVASSPTRCESPSRLVGSPRFATAQPRLSVSAQLDRRDPLSRSARRHRSIEGFSGEILKKSAKHSRTGSDIADSATTAPATVHESPAAAVQKWFSNILKPSHTTTTTPSDHTKPHQNHEPDPTIPTLPPKQPGQRRSRFQTDAATTTTAAAAIPISSRRTFKPAPFPDTQLLSPPKNIVESAHRRSISSSTCRQQENQVLSPPRNLVESAHRRSISSSTCSIEKIASKSESYGGLGGSDEAQDLNGFLKSRKFEIDKISNEEVSGKARIVLSGSSNSTSSMIAAICYAWLLENKLRKSKVEDDEERSVVMPVINVRRGRMWKQRQAAWLFHHVGIDATSLLFVDEVELESLMMARKLSILVIGQDILKTNGEVGSQCTILTDNYCEDAYDLLETPILKKLLLAGILLDTENLNTSAKLSMTRDSEAVQLLLVGSAPNYRNALFDQLMQDQRDGAFLEVLRRNYGKPPSNESYRDNGAAAEHKVLARKSASTFNHEATLQNLDKNTNGIRNAKMKSVSPKSAKPTSLPARASKASSDDSRGKNKFFLAKWFGFGNK